MKNTLIALALATAAVTAQAQDPRVWLDTDFGPIILELDPEAAPTTVENFLRYVDDGFYDGLIFHRVVDDFVIQSGGFNTDRELQEPTYDPIVNEADNGLSNEYGTVAMARTTDPDSAAAQFFINLENNDFLDPGGNTEAGYAVFGSIVLGFDTIEAIRPIGVIDSSNSPDPRFSSLRDYPYSPPIIRRAVRTDGFPLMADHSGSWYDADNSGVGFNVEIANNSAGTGPIAVVYWYNFAEGTQFWLTGQASFEWGASEVTVDLFSAESGSFQSAESEFTDTGTITLNFDGCDAGTFSYDLPDYGSGEIAVTRLTRPEGYVCRDE
jgi:cyclophilin family peptidyl-prolyl cis-trans isomerase